MRAAHFTNLLHATAEKLRPYAQTLWSYSGKARAIEWLERALAPGASIHALAATGEDDSIAAEALLALRSHPELARE